MQVSLSDDESETGLFASWFLENKNRASMAVVCPDSMSFVTDKSRETTTKLQWLNLAKAYQVILKVIVFVILHAFVLHTYITSMDGYFRVNSSALFFTT